MFKSLILLIALGATQIAYSAETAAKDTTKTYNLPSVTVSSTRAVESKSPVPFSEITRSAIEERNTVRDLPQLLSELPSVIVFSEGGAGVGYSNLTMRGFNQRRIAVYVNGVPQNDPEDHNVYWINMPDIASSLEAIQVQRGAGLASYGAAALGGSINLTTLGATDKRGIKVTTGYGLQERGGEMDPGANKVSIEARSGYSNGYSFYGRLSRIYSHGYRNLSWDDLSSFFFSAARIDDRLTTQINVFGGPFNDALSYNGLPKSYIGDKKLRLKNYSYFEYDSTGKNITWTTDRRKREEEGFSQPHYEILNDWAITDNLTLKSTVFYYTGDGYFDYDGAGWTDASSFRLTPENGFENAEDPQNPIIRAWVSNKHGGWLPQLIYNHDRGALVAGAEFRVHRSNHWGKLAFAENFPSGYDPDYKFYEYNGKRDIFSAFARESFELNEKLTLSGEMQVAYHRYAVGGEKSGKNYTYYQTIDGGVRGGGREIFNVKYLFFNPRIGANYLLGEHGSAYAFAALTSREPRMSNLYDASGAFYGETPRFKAKFSADSSQALYDFSSPLAKPEQLANLELGWNWKRGGSEVSANFYWMEYFDELVKSGRLDIFGNPIDGNAPRTRHFGAEIAAKTILLQWGDILLGAAGNATVSRNEIIDYNYALGGRAVSLAGNPVSGFPGFMSALRIDLRRGNFEFSATHKYVGSFRTDNFGGMLSKDPMLVQEVGYADNLLDAYSVVNFETSYRIPDIFSFKSVRLLLQINNVENKLYAAGAEGKEFFPAAERNYYFGIDFEL